MAKKRSRKTYTSKGERPNVSSETMRWMAQDRDPCRTILNKVAAWKRGKNPWITIRNPIITETAKRWVRVRANIVWGDPKGRREERRDQHR